MLYLETLVLMVLSSLVGWLVGWIWQRISQIALVVSKQPTCLILQMLEGDGWEN